MAWAVLHVIDNSSVPFEDREDLELEEKHIHISIQDVHFFHLQERFSEESASEILLRQSKDDEFDLLNNNPCLVPLFAFTDSHQSLK